ncbi:MAG: IS66 family insertion sequence element accessory protein TnpA [Gemmatimonadaceae bacterium]
MTATEQKWAERVAGWRESGLTSEKFCEGREFSADGLRHWAHKLGQTKPRRPKRKPKIAIARVVTAPATAPTKPPASAREAVDRSIAIELEGARIVVRPGFDRATLAALIDVLGGAR